MEYELEELDWLQFPHGVSEWGNWAEEHLHLEHGPHHGHLFSLSSIVAHGRLLEWLALAVICLLPLLRLLLATSAGRGALWRFVRRDTLMADAAEPELFSRLSLLGYARQIHPVGENKRRIKMVKFMLRGALHRVELERLWRVVGAPTLAPLRAADPGIVEKPLRPYLHARASLSERVTLLRQHYAFLRGHHAGLLARLFTPQGILLGSYPASEGESIRIVLRHDVTFRREGELSISLLNEAGQRLYSCAFNITERAGVRALVIGSLQGPEPAVVEPMALIQQLTKRGFGLRPKSLMVMLAFMLARAWQIDHLYAIPKAAHVFQAKRYRHRNGLAMHADYDELWREFDAIELADNLWQLPSYQRRPLEEIASKKRSMYRQRYGWLDALESAIQEAVAS